MKNSIKKKALFLLALIFFSLVGCHNNDIKTQEEILDKYSNVMLVYRSALDVYIAEQELLKLEDYLESHDGEIPLIGSDTVNDYLYATRLRLWGIYRFNKNNTLKDQYREKISSMDGAVGNSSNDDWLLEQLKHLDVVAAPHWDPDPEKEILKSMSIEEMLEKGYIEMEIH